MPSDEERNQRMARSRKPSRYTAPNGVEVVFEPGSHGRVQDYEPLTVFFVEALERRLGERSRG